MLHADKFINANLNIVIGGDALTTLKKFPDESVDCVVTSPPYWGLRDYGMESQIGLEISVEEYLEKLLDVFSEVRRILKSSGTCWVIIGDTYANKSKRGHHRNIQQTAVKKATTPQLKPELSISPKSLCLVPVRFAVKMIEQNWILRNEIIWHKPNQMPQSASDRFTVDFEKIFFFVKERRYYFRQQFETLQNPERLGRKLVDPQKEHKRERSYWYSARPQISEKRRLKILQTGRNKRSVWRIGTANFSGNHFAVYPEKLIETPILAGCPEGGIVLDPFIGSGTTGVVARKLNRQFIGIELNPEYVRIAENRLKKSAVNL